MVQMARRVRTDNPKTIMYIPLHSAAVNQANCHYFFLDLCHTECLMIMFILQENRFTDNYYYPNVDFVRIDNNLSNTQY